jgi:hypothetical protein
MNTAQQENHPWLKTYTVMCLLFIGIEGILALFGGDPFYVKVLYLFIFSTWIYGGIYLIRSTNWYHNWSNWVALHPKGKWLAYWFLAIGAGFTFCTLAIPYVIVNGITAGIRGK